MMTPAKMLTKRQFEILKLIAQGKQNKEIALMLNISENTVEQHITSIYKKLEAHSRVEVALRFVEHNGNPL